MLLLLYLDILSFNLGHLNSLTLAFNVFSSQVSFFGYLCEMVQVPENSERKILFTFRGPTTCGRGMTPLGYPINKSADFWQYKRILGHMDITLAKWEHDILEKN